MEPSVRTKLLTAGVIAIVFGSGFAVGVAVDRSAVAGPAPEAVADSTVADTASSEEPRRRSMYEQVGPSPEQKTLIDSIVRIHREKTRGLRREYDFRLGALIDSTRLAIKEVFTAEQAARYDSLVAEYDRRQAEERAARDDN
ncbi:MAG: hypothetical protein RH859_06770 [Longimicrobiales bacterium]